MQEGTVTREPEPRAPKSQVADSEATESHESLPEWHGRVELCCPRTGLICWVSLPSSCEEGPSLVRAVGFLEGAGSGSNLGRPCREAARVVQAGNTHLNEYSFPEGDGEPWRKIILVIRQRVDWSTWEQEHGPNFYRGRKLEFIEIK